MAKFTFDGVNKLIIGDYTISGGVAQVDALIDIYSDWKEWSQQGDNFKFLQALSTVGGDEISAGLNVGAYFFLENGWKIRPKEANHRLIVNGNLYTRDGSQPFVATTGSFNVLTEIRNSNLTEQVETGGAGGASSDEMYLNAGLVSIRL